MDHYHYLNSLPLFGSQGGYKPGLSRIAKILFYLGNPEQNLKVIHLAGTNGKGSTAATLANIYQSAGYKVGLYTSPHFFNFNERIKLNGKAVTSSELKELLPQVKAAAVKAHQADGLAAASFFEIVTALALLVFKHHDLDLVVLETGLGGRLDATNIIKNPLLSIITTISLEHTAILGDSIAQVASEKAGIIKYNVPVLTAVTQKAALEVIKRKAALEKANLIILDQEYKEIVSDSSFEDNLLYLTKQNGQKYCYKLSLLGRHQARNTALALRAVQELNQQYPVREDQISDALIKIYWPGRMQKISDRPTVILDAAHNPAAFQELVNNLTPELAKFKRTHFIFSILRDKNLTDILEIIAPLKNKVKFHLAENLSFRTVKTEVLSSAFAENGFSYRSYQNLSQAAAVVAKESQKEDLIIAAGSFNTVFEVGINFFENNIS